MKSSVGALVTMTKAAGGHRRTQPASEVRYCRAMGETVEFASNGDTAAGYLAVPASGSGPGLLVVQEWWGLVPQIKKTCDRLAEEGLDVRTESKP